MCSTASVSYSITKVKRRTILTRAEKVAEEELERGKRLLWDVRGGGLPIVMESKNSRSFWENWKSIQAPDSERKIGGRKGSSGVVGVVAGRDFIDLGTCVTGNRFCSRNAAQYISWLCSKSNNKAFFFTHKV